jgi:branched-subunit amino acid aminotransferase/4-amino-4-deoxychorismate lyase
MTLPGTRTETILRLRPLPDSTPLSLTLHTEETERPAFMAYKTMATAIHWAPFPLSTSDIDVLKVSPSGRLLETRFANVFLYTNGHWVTPSGVNIVDGVTRAWLMDHLPVPIVAHPLTIGDLVQASEIFVCNAIRGIWEVTSVSGYSHLKSAYRTADVTRFYDAALATGFKDFP